ncbi:hypothetical protein P7L70_01430 (plasmid) [Tistrella mobilis]|uniref:hypothetical protein n=1 Tax=Tistrella mobilis TaxID=171437 RepID=UPI00355747BC
MLCLVKWVDLNGDLVSSREVDIDLKLGDTVAVVRRRLVAAGIPESCRFRAASGEPLPEAAEDRPYQEVFTADYPDDGQPSLTVTCFSDIPAAEPRLRKLAEDKAEIEMLASDTAVLTARKAKLDADRAVEEHAEAAVRRRDERDREALDDRQKLLDRLRVTVPDPTAQIGTAMADTALAKRDFAAEAATRVFTAGGGTLAADHSDFFTLNLAQRDDLLDRIGFYRGIVIDHSRSEVAARSFRDVLYRLDLRGDAAARRRLAGLSDAKPADPDKTRGATEAALMAAAAAALITSTGQQANPAKQASPTQPAAQPEPIAQPQPVAKPAAGAPPVASRPATPTGPTRLFYLKPQLSGYYETSYTYSEQVHQAQRNGVFGLSMSMTAAVGKPSFQGGIGVGVGIGRLSETTTAEAGKTVFVVTSYFLPRVELSFDDRTPSAAPDFLAAVTAALDPADPVAIDPWPELIDPAERLMAVLAIYGHFVARRTLVGGRLFGTRVQTLSATEGTADVTRSLSVGVKAEVSHLGVGTAQAAAEMKDATREQSRALAAAERQGLTLSAVGGEGQFLSDAGEWAKSLGNYRRWSAVMQDDPMPSIDLLPRDLAQRCRAVLRDYASRHTVQELQAKGAHFLFYNEYRRIAGESARPVYFRIRNRMEPDKVLSLLMDQPGNGVEVGLRDAGMKADPASQLWYENGLGQIVAYSCSATAEFALTALTDDVVTGPAGRPPADRFKLAITVLDTAPYQSWTLTAAGHLINTGLEAGLTAVGRFDPAVTGSFRLSDLWMVDPLSPEELTALLKTSDGADATRDPYLARDRRKAEDARPGTGLTIDTPFCIIARRAADPAAALAVNADMALSIEGTGDGHLDGHRAVLARLVIGRHQVWTTDGAGRLFPAQSEDAPGRVCLTHRNGTLVLAPQDEARNNDQLWRYDARGERLVLAATGRIAGLFTPGCDTDPHATQPLRVQSPAESSFARFQLIDAGQPDHWPQLLPDWASANDRTWLYSLTFGGRYACRVIIYNESAVTIRLKDRKGLRGGFAAWPVDRIPAHQTAPTRWVFADYVWNPVSDGDAVGWLRFQIGDDDARPVDVAFGVPGAGSLTNARAQIWINEGGTDVGALFGAWDGCSSTSHLVRSVYGMTVDCVVSAYRDDVVTFTIGFRGQPA